MKICKVENCSNKQLARNYCRKHYYQFMKYGYIPKRTILTLNKIIIRDKYCVMDLYDKNCKKIAETLFDLEYLKKVQNIKWHLSHNYANNSKVGFLHNIIGGHGDGNKIVIDHINRNKLDNRKINLRLTTKSVNAMNSKLHYDNLSGYKGVVWHKERNFWTANITINRKRRYLGHFKKIGDAVNARKRAEKIYWRKNNQLLFQD